MDDINVGDVIGYQENYRANGRVGGWASCHYRGLVVKVNAKSLHVRRQLGSWAGNRFVSYGYENTVRVIPRERTYTI